jgi:hypothetical protein
MTYARLATQVVATAPDKVGLLARGTTALLGAGLNIFAITARESNVNAKIVVVTDDDEAAAEALVKLGWAVVTEPIVILDMPDELGALDEAVHRIADAGVNISLLFATTADGSHATVIVQTTDDEKVAELF